MICCRTPSILRKRLEEFGVRGRIDQINPGPVITGYEFEPAAGVKVTHVVNLADDLALAMKAGAVRVFGPVPGRGTVAIEVPNSEPQTVSLREILGLQGVRRVEGRRCRWPSARTPSASPRWPTSPPCRTSWWPAPLERGSRRASTP